MSVRTVLLSLFLAASVLLDAAVLVQPPSPVRAISMLGLAFGQSGLVALWLATGRGWLGWRFCGALWAVSLLAFALSNATRPQPGQCFSALALCAGCVCLVKMAARGAGRWTDSCNPTAEFDGPSNHRTPLSRQYSVASLLGLMTAVAVSCAVSTWMDWKWLAMRGPANSCAAFVTVTLLATWGTCVPGSVWRVGLLIAASPMVGVGVAVAEGAQFSVALGWALFLQAVYLGCATAVIRNAVSPSVENEAPPALIAFDIGSYVPKPGDARAPDFHDALSPGGRA